MKYHTFLKQAHPSWQPLLAEALKTVEIDYLMNLQEAPEWLPGINKIFNAFSLPLEKTNYILFGESPYPRMASANGYAFWDAAVEELWSPMGMSKRVNRATSLRHFIKMLLIADGLLSPEDPSQSAIVDVDKTHLVSTLNELFGNLIDHGFLLLNASLVLSKRPVIQDAKAWRPFIHYILKRLAELRPNITLVLLGRIAQAINQFPVAKQFRQISAIHPYNAEFMHDPMMINFFKRFHLLNKKTEKTKHRVAEEVK